MSFTKLSLFQEKIPQAIRECISADSDPVFVQKGTGRHYNLSYNGTSCLLIFFFNSDGTTTIQTSAGPNPIASEEIAKYVVSKCLRSSLSSFDLSFKNIKEEDFDLLMKYLTEESGGTVTEEVKEKLCVRRIIQSPYGDKITIKYYNNCTLQLQGKPLYLYSEAKTFIYELLSFEEIAEKESEALHVSITKDDLRGQLQMQMPVAYGFLHDRVVKILTPSLAYKRLEIDLEDYSSFVFPALRGLEGYIRQLLELKGKTSSVAGIRKIGAIFKEDKKSGRFALLGFAAAEIGCPKACTALEECYNLYNSRRHPFFHVSPDMDRTPLVWKKSTAEAYIDEVLNLIEESYKKIVS